MLFTGSLCQHFGTELLKLISASHYLRHSRKLVTNVRVFKRKLSEESAVVNLRQCQFSSAGRPPWSVLFFGTDEFSVASLKTLTRELNKGQLIRRLEVVTSMKTKVNAVQKFAEKNNLPVHDWSLNIESNEFDIGLVVSFGHLIPKNIISSFPLGMLNVHASLLPRWRGAAPIVYAIMNGDAETGVSVMQIKPHKFDVGGVLKQAKYEISPSDTLPIVSSALSELGAQILLECVRELPGCLDCIKPQPTEGVTNAPRLSSTIGVVQWQLMSSLEVYNLWRALYKVFPLITKWRGLPVRLLEAEPYTNVKNEEIDESLNSVGPGYVFYHRPSRLLKVKCSDGFWVSFKKIGVSKKKEMSPTDFYNGYMKNVKKEERYFECESSH